MANFFDYNWKEVIHSKSGERIKKEFGDYLRYTHQMGNWKDVLSNLYSETIAAAVTADFFHDPNPAASAKATSLGAYFRTKVAKVRTKDSAANIDKWAYGGAEYVYNQLHTYVVFTADEVQAPFFAEVAGAVVSDVVAKGVGTYVKAQSGSEAAGEATEAMISAGFSAVGRKIMERLGQEFAKDGVIILNPKEWPKRAWRAAANNKIIDDFTQAGLIEAQTAILNAKNAYMLAKHQQTMMLQGITLEKAQAQLAAQGGKVNAQGQAVSSIEAQRKALKKKQVIQIAGIAGGGAVVLITLLLLARR